MASPGSLSSSHGKLNDDPRLKAQGDTFSHLFSLDSQVHSAPLLSRREWYTDTMASLSLNESLQRSCDKNTGSNISSETKPLALIPKHCGTFTEWWRGDLTCNFISSEVWSCGAPTQSVPVDQWGNFYRIVKSPRREGKTLLIWLNWWSETNPPAPHTIQQN